MRTTNHSGAKVSRDHPGQPSAQSKTNFTVKPNGSEFHPFKFSIPPGMEVQQPPWASVAALHFSDSKPIPPFPHSSSYFPLEFPFHALGLFPLVLLLCPAKGSSHHHPSDVLWVLEDSNENLSKSFLLYRVNKSKIWPLKALQSSHKQLLISNSQIFYRSKQNFKKNFSITILTVERFHTIRKGSVIIRKLLQDKLPAQSLLGAKTCIMLCS